MVGGQGSAIGPRSRVKTVNTIRTLGLWFTLAGAGALPSCRCGPAHASTGAGADASIRFTFDGSFATGDAGPSIDPNDPLNATRDSDCDGLNDAEEFGNTYPGGKPTQPDSEQLQQ